MSVNDVLCHAAEPLFFLDCFSCSKLDVDAAYHVVSSISRGCQMAGCALIGSLLVLCLFFGIRSFSASCVTLSFGIKICIVR